jgi:hypothetical protein
VATHLFAVGERVSLTLSTRGTANQADVFTVKTRLPHVGTQLQYRVKTEGEPYERVVTEGQLTKVGLETAVAPTA